MILKAKIQDRGIYIAVGEKFQGKNNSDQYLPREEKICLRSSKNRPHTMAKVIKNLSSQN